MNETEYVLVEAIQQIRVRYVVEVPKDKKDWALDSVALNEAEEFSQSDLGETIVSHRVVSRDEILTLFDEDNEMFRSLDSVKKFDLSVNFYEDDMIEY